MLLWRRNPHVGRRILSRKHHSSLSVLAWGVGILRSWGVSAVASSVTLLLLLLWYAHVIVAAHYLVPLLVLLVLVLHHEVVLVELLVKGLLLVVVHFVEWKWVWKQALVRNKASRTHRLRRHARVGRHAHRVAARTKLLLLVVGHVGLRRRLR